MQNVTLSTVETALCKGLQQILLEYDDGFPLSIAVLQRLELRCIEHIHVAFSLAWATMDRDLRTLRTGHLGRSDRVTSDPSLISTVDQTVPSEVLVERLQPPDLQHYYSNTHHSVVASGSIVGTACLQEKEATTSSREEERNLDSTSREPAEEQSNINSHDINGSNGSSSSSKGGGDMDWDQRLTKAGRSGYKEGISTTTTSPKSTHRERAPRKNTSFRKGLYAEVVGLRGPLPTCQTCREKIARGQRRFILHRAIGTSPNAITFYHFNKTCIDGAKLSSAEQEIASVELAVKQASAGDHVPEFMSPIKNE